MVLNGFFRDSVGCEKFSMPPPGRFHFVSLRRTGSWTKDRPGEIDNSFLLEVRKDSTLPKILSDLAFFVHVM